MLFRHHVDTEAMCGFVAANGLRDLLTQQSCVTVSIRMEPTDQKIRCSANLGGNFVNIERAPIEGVVFECLKPGSKANRCHTQAYPGTLKRQANNLIRMRHRIRIARDVELEP